MPWTCQRQKAGVRCRHRNPNVKRKCVKCGGAKPAKVRPKHMAALDYDYAYYVALNGGEHCGICGREPSAKRRLDRDHEHRGQGRPRGLLCWRCNAQLKGWMTPSWLAAAAAYLARSAKEGTATDVRRMRGAETAPRQSSR